MKQEEYNLTEQVVMQLLETISKGEFEEGELFATESELEEKFGVSRPILREAISRLRALGFLKSKQKKGLIVSKPDFVHLFEWILNYGVFDTTEVYELAELRYIIEVGAIELSAKRATEEDIKKLYQLAQEFKESIKPNYVGREQDKIELDFHRTLLESTHNSLISRMHSVLSAFFAKAHQEYPDWQVHSKDEKGVWEHLAIAEAIAEHNVEKARAILSSHLSGLLTPRTIDKEKKDE